jgi:hypothetical protein
MYTNWEQMWAGFTKNFFAAFQFSTPKLLGFALFNFILYILPWLAAIAMYLLFPATNVKLLAWDLPLWSLYLAAGCWSYLLRILLALRHPVPWWSILLHPMAIGLMIAVALNSSYQIVSGQGVSWKGRQYQR